MRWQSPEASGTPLWLCAERLGSEDWDRVPSVNHRCDRAKPDQALTQIAGKIASVLRCAAGVFNALGRDGEQVAKARRRRRRTEALRNTERALKLAVAFELQRLLHVALDPER